MGRRYWTKLRLLAAVVGLVGAWGILQALAGLPGLFSRQPVPNLVYGNDQRLPPLDDLEQLRTAFPGNFATVSVLVFVKPELALAPEFRSPLAAHWSVNRAREASSSASWPFGARSTTTTVVGCTSR
jgi:hypothetical protein